MTKKEFTELTGEDPEDVLGGDWENEIVEIAEQEQVNQSNIKK